MENFARRIAVRILATVLLIFATRVSALSSGSAVASPDPPLEVMVLTDVAGLGDKGFNDVCWQGVLRAKQDFALKARFVQAREQADYLSNITLAAQNADVVVTLGYLFVDALKQVTPGFPGTRFIHIEGDVTGENVASFDFKSEQGGFLAGLVAGLFTKSLKVGVVSGMDIPPVKAYVNGFKSGVKTAEEKRAKAIEVIVVSAGSFNDPVKGKSLAQALIAKGADVIFRLAGNTGIGVMEAIADRQGVYLIAEDLDMDAEMPGKILASTLKRMDVAIYQAIEGIVQGRFEPGHHWLGAAQGAIDLSPMKYSQQLFTPRDMEWIDKARRLLKEGKISVPKSDAELADFQIPEL